MTNLKAKELTLDRAERLLNIQKQPAGNFAALSLEPLSEFETQELVQIREDFDNYLASDRVSEGLVKALTTFPLMRLAGFYRHPIKISLEEDIAAISIEDEDTTISGRFDILAVNKQKSISGEHSFWVLVIEAKNSYITPRAGLLQLLTYAYQTLKRQQSVWGLATNGEFYQFVYLEAGNPPHYREMPALSLMDPNSAIQVLQVLKAIAKL